MSCEPHDLWYLETHSTGPLHPPSAPFLDLTAGARVGEAGLRAG